MLLRILTTALLLTSSGLAHAGSRSIVQRRAEALVDAVNRDGLQRVVARSPDSLDRSLLELIADVQGEHGLAQSLRVSPDKKRDAWLIEGSTAEGGSNAPPIYLTSGAPEIPDSQRSYRVTFENYSGETLSEVVAFWRSPTSALAGQTSEANVTAGTARTLNLGQCNLLVSYVLGVFVDGHRVLRLPPEGQEMTPALASQLHPQDDQPCADSWALHAQPAP